MTWVLVRKLLRDVRTALIVVGLFLALFQCLWAKITERVLGQLAPFLFGLADASGLVPQDVEEVVFQGPGRILRSLIGGETITLDRAMDMMSIGYVHPLMQTLFCIWAIGRAAGAIAGELDRGTLELLLAQPLPRSRLVLAHLIVDLITIPLLALSLWAGSSLGAWLVSPIQIQPIELAGKAKPPPSQPPEKKPAYIVEFGPFKMRLESPAGAGGNDQRGASPHVSGQADEAMRERLKIESLRFGPALVVVAALMFAVSGLTLLLSAVGRFRWRVLGLAVLLVLVQFLINLLGQMWEVLAPLRPLTVFYYFQPQQVILSGNWYVTLREWNGGTPLARVPMVGVLAGVGLAGYGLALWVFTRRDLPAPL
jgi:ABC-2 type transport system permease protein